VLVPKTFIRDFKGYVVYVSDRTPGGGILKDIWSWELDNRARVKRLVRADSGRVDFDDRANQLVVRLYSSKVEERNPANPEDFSVSPKAPSVEKAEDIKLPLASTLGQDIFHVKPEWLRFGALQERRAALENAKPQPGEEKEMAISRMKLAMIVYEKANLSLAVLAFAFIAVPLGIKVSRRETSANLGVAVLLVLGYYFLLTMVKWLDQHPEYRPDLLLWVPNLILFWFGFTLLRRVER
jgi:lipopolysaccharide export system permease protein